VIIDDLAILVLGEPPHRQNYDTFALRHIPLSCLCRLIVIVLLARVNILANKGFPDLAP
jgi:hypothetical protein